MDTFVSEQVCLEEHCSPWIMRVWDWEEWESSVKDFVLCVCMYIYIYIFNNSSRQTRCNKRSISSSLTNLNPKFSFSLTGFYAKIDKFKLPYYLPLAGGKIVGFISFLCILAIHEMQTVSSKILIRFTMSISFNIFWIYHHYRHVALSARMFLTLSRHTSLLSIVSGKSLSLHPVLAQRCCM